MRSASSAGSTVDGGKASGQGDVAPVRSVEHLGLDRGQAQAPDLAPAGGQFGRIRAERQPGSVTGRGVGRGCGLNGFEAPADPLPGWSEVCERRLDQARLECPAAVRSEPAVRAEPGGRHELQQPVPGWREVLADLVPELRQRIGRESQAGVRAGRLAPVLRAEP
jgi:hypothetical protein